jgi:hypothetical protein
MSHASDTQLLADALRYAVIAEDLRRGYSYAVLDDSMLPVYFYFGADS